MSSKIPVVFVSNPSQKTKYYCTDCKFSSFDIGELLKHKSFKDHKSIASTKIVRSDFISVFDCNLCNKNFKCSSDLKRHNNERHINKSCSICSTRNPGLDQKWSTLDQNWSNPKIFFWDFWSGIFAQNSILVNYSRSWKNILRISIPSGPGWTTSGPTQGF